MANEARKHNKGMTGFDVHDIGLATALMSVGHELVTLHTDDDCGCKIFHFDTTPRVEEDVEAYWKNKLSVDAKQYWTTCEYLLDRLFGDLQDED
jgi:hypothetical protein